MNIYEIGADRAYGVFTHVGSDDTQYFEWRRQYEATGWHPPRLESPGGYAKVLPLDCVASALGAGQDMLLNARAREALAQLLLPCGEYLPVQLDGLDYCCFNCTTVVDVADQDRIEGERSKYLIEPPNCWKSITRWSFHPERVAIAPAAFTVPQKRRVLMCTDVLRQAVEAHDLLGFQFDLLWSSEDGGVTVDNSLSQFMGESGRQRNIAAKERRKAMQARLKGRLAKATPTPL